MLLDTFGLLCYLDRRDTRHTDALELFRFASVRVTHNYVLAELAALCQARGLNRVTILEFITELVDNPHVDLIWVDEVLHRAAVLLLKSRLDKRYSLCDAVSFILMRHRNLTDALTTDRHFEQEGFTRLWKP